MSRKSQARSAAKNSSSTESSKKRGELREFPSPASTRGPMQQPKPPYMKAKLQKPGLQSEMKPAPRDEGSRYRPAGKLEGKVALITGGDSGIGRSVAVLYAREKADVAIVYLPEEQSDAEQTREAVQEHGRKCLLIPGDVTDPDFCRKAVRETMNHYGRIDVLVNNAAFQNSQEDIEEISEQQWDHTFRTNIYGYFHMAKAAIPYLKPGSAIVNTGSITGLRGNKDLLDYSATKGAIHAFTKSLAQNLVQKKIRVNCVAPGPIWTPLVASDYEPDETAQHGANTPMKRAGQPEEVAPAYVFLASEADSSYITGEIINLFGGRT
ncbi:MAG TPA: SDR family oxidoreductase [Terriglobales bacterium]|nr:SDR family oxidoreductase [Terriglobales bacterium]